MPEHWLYTMIRTVSSDTNVLSKFSLLDVFLFNREQSAAEYTLGTLKSSFEVVANVSFS